MVSTLTELVRYDEVLHSHPYWGLSSILLCVDVTFPAVCNESEGHVPGD